MYVILRHVFLLLFAQHLGAGMVHDAPKEGAVGWLPAMSRHKSAA
jgi:hypothetical protein